ncbi:unnamed protein product [Didymodactylos carnosus]|uniref:Uncharacterized protein n=1 Tax=Didymodactylos carnosus TaxID=1234261 RepID=A0A8S2FB06_9BILA|nr:unnamed protein product [Didymodactylos carnosus]CAF4211997.1 unnamed protein product [Didymodactylos carnosus]
MRRLSLTIKHDVMDANHQLFTNQIFSKTNNCNYLNTTTTSFSSFETYFSNSSDLIDHDEEHEDDDNNGPDASDGIEHLLSSKTWLIVTAEPIISAHQTFYNQNNDSREALHLYN